jgi:phosphodiesterase/alkaline phosphatase D-like protein
MDGEERDGSRNLFEAYQPQDYGMRMQLTARDGEDTARSPIRLAQSHPDQTFRVRLACLAPQTTYYYRVTSLEGNGRRDEVRSPVHEFTIP